MGVGHPNWITLNVGGHKFNCQRTLFEEEPDSILAKMVEGHRFCQIDRTKDGTYLIDRSPEYFKVVLNYFRTGKVFISSDLCWTGVLEEARFFAVEGMIQKCEEIKFYTPNMP